MRKITIGCCGTFEESSLLREVGFDYLECPVSELVPDKSEEEFEAWIRSFERELEELPVYAFNCFIPGSLRVTGPEVDMQALRSYVETVFRRVDRLDGEVVVFGSGGARSVPEDFSREMAWRQIIDFLLMCSELAADYGITVVIEPLRREESNILNTLEEALSMVKEVDRAGQVRALVDLYHMEEENEPYSNIRKAGSLLAHVHVADSGRLYPGTGSYDYHEFLRQLEEIGYEGGVSIECRWGDKEQEVKPALDFLRETGL